MLDSLLSATRRCALWAAPLSLASLAVLIGAVVLAGEDQVALLASPTSIAASVLGLLALSLLLLGLAGLPLAYRATASGFGLTAWLVAMVGTALGIGGEWSLLFVLPGLANEAPDLAINGLPSVTIGFVVSYLVMAIGWAMIGIRLVRSGAPRGAAITTLVGGVLMIVPLPGRFFLVAIGAALLFRAVSVRPEPVPVSPAT